MSYRDDKVEETKRAGEGGLARRPLKSFVRGAGYRFEVLEWDPGQRKGSERRPLRIAYQEADERTEWRCIEGLDGDVFEIIPEATVKKTRERE